MESLGNNLVSRRRKYRGASCEGFLEVPILGGEYPVLYALHTSQHAEYRFPVGRLEVYQNIPLIPKGVLEQGRPKQGTHISMEKGNMDAFGPGAFQEKGN
jgi:hypothetical protein